MNVPSPLRNILNAVGVDRAIFYSLMGQGWRFVASIVTILLIKTYLSPAEQGFYYTFASVLALQIFFDLGLSYVVLQFTSHERSKLKWTPQGTLEGNEEAKCRLASLLRLAMKWYSGVALLVLLVVVPAGALFFLRNQPTDINVNWFTPWICLGIGAAGSTFLSPLASFVEGTGKVADIALMRTTQSMCMTLSVWLGLTANLKLFAASIAYSAVFLCGLMWLAIRYGHLIKNLLSLKPGLHKIDWWQEIWPFQWKIAVSWASGYLIFQVFNPVLLAFQGAAVAGRMGMSLSILTAISTASLSWVSTKAAPFGGLVAKKDYNTLDIMFFKCLKQSLVIISVAGATFLGVTYLLDYYNHSLSDRLLPPQPLAFLVGAIIVNHVVASEAVYLRAHKEEPFLYLSLATGILTSVSAVVFAKYSGVIAVTAAYFAVSLLVGLGSGTIIFKQKRQEWHTTPQKSEKAVNLYE